MLRFEIDGSRCSVLKKNSLKIRGGNKQVTFSKSGEGFLPRQRLDKHQIAFRNMDTRAGRLNNLIENWSKLSFNRQKQFKSYIDKPVLKCICVIK